MKRYTYKLPDKLTLVCIATNKKDALRVFKAQCKANLWPESMIKPEAIK